MSKKASATTKEKKPLSQAQLDQRRAAGKALKAKVSREYYRLIGRRGGRRTLYNQLMTLAETFNGFPCEIKCSPERLQEIIADQRAHYKEQAEYWKDDTGNMVMVELLSPDFEPGDAIKNRLPVPKMSKGELRRYHKDSDAGDWEYLGLEAA